MALLSLLQLAAASRPDGAASSLAIAESTMTAGQMTPLHAHAQDEAIHVLDGAVSLHLGDTVVRLAAGDSYLVPAGVAHTVRAESARARCLAAMHARSVARYEDFVRAVGRPGPIGDAGPALDAIAAANGTLVLGAPGALPSVARAA